MSLLLPFHVSLAAGAVNARVEAHNTFTGYDESWTQRIFLAEHVREGAQEGL